MTEEDMLQMDKKFESCRKILRAFGDETRQHLLMTLMRNDGAENGLRAVDLAKEMNLSRTAVLHHLQIMQDAGIIKSRKEGTCIFYYVYPDESVFDQVIEMFQVAKTTFKY